MPTPPAPVAAEPKGPRVPAALREALDDDVDPQFPDLDGLDLADVVLSFAEARTLTVLRGRLRSCTLEIGDAAIDAQDAHFVDVDLSGCRFEGLTRVSFERCRLTGADFGEARMRDVRFADCAMDLASMRSTNLERVAMIGGRADELDLSAATLTDVTLTQVAVGELTLAGAKLLRVDVTESDLSAVPDLRELRGAIITTTQAVALAPRLARVAGMTVAVTPN